MTKDIIGGTLRSLKREIVTKRYTNPNSQYQYIGEEELKENEKFF